MIINNNKLKKLIILLMASAVFVNALLILSFVSFNDYATGSVFGEGSAPDFDMDNIKSVSTIPWVSELFITNYRTTGEITRTGYKFSSLFSINSGTRNSFKKVYYSTKCLEINENRINQEMKMHISRLTAG